MNSKFMVKFRDNPDSMEFTSAPFSPTYRWRFPSKSIIEDLEENGVSLDTVIQAMETGAPFYEKKMVDDDYFIITIIEPHKNGTWRVAVGDSPNGRFIDYWNLDLLVKKVA